MMKSFSTILFFCLPILLMAQTNKTSYTRKDTLMGSNTPGRNWWDVQRYEVSVTPDYDTKTITGKVTITYTVTADQHSDYLQIDLQKPLAIDSLYFNGNIYSNDPSKPFYNEGDHWFIPLPKTPKGTTQSITVVYQGKPKEATNAPWDGGWVWTKDKQGRPWMSVACQGDGASLWYPCKDYWADEPDLGASLTINVPQNLIAVGNGRLASKTSANGKTSFRWEVKNPINTYNIIPYIGHYTNWTDTLQGEKSSLDLNYWVLDYELANARKQFEQVKPTLRAFEYWFGPYPFYEDGYQLIQSPYLGMEHQSAVAYGNEFKNGYLGTDLSGTGWGLKWDYIIVHETGHEWFGNNITAKDRADMWIQEGFTDYSETLFTEYYYGKQAGNEYTQGLRRNIANDRPIIADYGVNKEGSGDMYFKGANLLHTIRQVINDDQKFRQILRGLGKDFYHQTVTSAQVEKYMSEKSGKDLSKIFDQYLRNANIPTLDWKKAGSTIQYRWINVIPEFNMPIRLSNGQWISPKATWQTIRWPFKNAFSVDANFYIDLTTQTQTAVQKR